MKISDKWEIVPGPRAADFMLKEWYEGKTKDGGIKMRSTDTYHPSIQQCLDKIVRQEGLEAVELGTVREVLAKLDEVKQVLQKHTQET